MNVWTYIMKTLHKFNIGQKMSRLELYFIVISAGIRIVINFNSLFYLTRFIVKVHRHLKLVNIFRKYVAEQYNILNIK